MSQLTYREAGVDIDAGNKAVDLMKKHVRSTYRPEVLGDIGGFGGLFALNTGKYRQPVLVSGTDGVGTKLCVAFMADKHDTIGQDAVAMCVNDILVQGAEPLFFLDYLAVGKLEPEKVAAIVSGIAGACLESGCSLIGGETAEMASFYKNGEYDIGGFAVGVAERSKLITGEKIQPGDVLIGLPSSGLHSNGYSLVRKICFDVKGFTIDQQIPELGKTLGDELLVPTKLYPKACLPLIEKFDIRGMVHITGGGFYENIPRVLPEGCGVEVNTEAWPKPEIFGLVQQWGNVAWPEMYRTFNMGIGMILVVPQSEVSAIQEDLTARGEVSYVIGHVTDGPREAVLKGGIFGE
ncbi:phosphoribosylformylglycinamidine cyclo-ligase [Pelosinus sp. sgz500959]|uniref:phosphoribosylformylglycinamidine cyclo-ligase n=1 Tax=Pelosinus sp. sgz500959 TaxID=3242472 RepID=UPI00366A89C1